MSKETAHAPASGHSTLAESLFLRPSFLLLVAIVLLGTGIRLYFFNPGIARSPDERTYAIQANVILAQGYSGLTALGQSLVRDPAHVALAPSPARVGYLTMLAAWMRLAGDRTPLAGAQLSLLCSLAALVLIAFTAYRALSAPAAVVATLLYAVFPFELTTYRRAWQDSLIAFVALTIVSAALFIARSRSLPRAAGYFSFFILGVLSITTKENLGIFFMLCAAGLTLHFLLQRERRPAILTASCAAAAGIVSLAIFALIFGGIGGYIALERAFVHYTHLGIYDLQFNTGPAWMFPAGFLRACPIQVVAALAGFCAVLHRILRSRSLSSAGFGVGISLLTLCMIAIQLATTTYNFRYAAPAYGLICLLGGIGVEATLPKLRELLFPLGIAATWAILGFALTVAVLRDFNYARDIFLLPGQQDLALRTVLGVAPLPIPPGYPR